MKHEEKPNGKDVFSTAVIIFNFDILIFSCHRKKMVRL